MKKINVKPLFVVVAVASSGSATAATTAVASSRAPTIAHSGRWDLKDDRYLHIEQRVERATSVTLRIIGGAYDEHENGTCTWAAPVRKSSLIRFHRSKGTLWTADLDLAEDSRTAKAFVLPLRKLKFTARNGVGVAESLFKDYTMPCSG